MGGGATLPLSLGRPSHSLGGYPKARGGSVDASGVGLGGVRGREATALEASVRLLRRIVESERERDHEPCAHPSPTEIIITASIP